MRRAYAYLVKTRLLNREAVSFFAKQKLIYESCEKSKDGTKEYHNVIFVGLDENEVARHAHKRGLYTEGGAFRGNVDGCDPAYSFHYIGTDNMLFVFEAPIDLLSYIPLHPQDWQKHSYVALCGLSNKPCLRKLELHPNLDHVVLCLDHDQPESRPPKYTAICSVKWTSAQAENVLQNKDWNEDIKAKNGLPPSRRGNIPSSSAGRTLC
jgi:hypothetical protein